MGEVKQVTASDGLQDCEFGNSIDLYEDTLIVGSHLSEIGSWVSLDGNIVVVGAVAKNVNHKEDQGKERRRSSSSRRKRQ